MPAKKFSYYSLILIVAVIFTVVGCGIFPKRVEFFQDKVKPVPEKTEKAKEKDRQAAEYVDRKVKEAESAANKEESSPAVTLPLHDASVVADSLKLSLGPPKKLWDDDGEQLAKEMRAEIAKLNKKIDDFRTDNDKNVGKSIEGSGLFSFNYFIYIGGILVLFSLIGYAIKIYGMINPVVGVAGNVAKIPVKVVTQGFKQVISAGETFKKAIDKKIDDPKTKEMVLELFRSAHEQKQDEQVQEVIKTLTK